jgi:hypothetical protein
MKSSALWMKKCDVSGSWMRSTILFFFGNQIALGITL